MQHFEEDSKCTTCPKGYDNPGRCLHAFPYCPLALWSHELIRCQSSEFQHFLSAFHADGLSFMELATQDFDRQWVL